MRLYDAPPSGNCHKVRMMFSFLDLDYEKVSIVLPKAEQKSVNHLARHPLGKVPALEDGVVTVWDSQAILVYLARKFDSANKWLPVDPVGQAHVTQWLSFAAKEMWDGPAVARAIPKFNRPGDHADAQELARGAFQVLEGHLGNREWLVGDGPTIADIAVYPYVGLVWEGQVSLNPYLAVTAWMRRIEALPNYVGMDGLPH
jgi:glutathione S-transferase